MRNTFNRLTKLSVVIALFALTATMASAQIVINQDTVFGATIAGNKLTVSGSFVVYNPANCLAVLNNVVLPILSCNGSQMVAQLSTIPPVGTYRLFTEDAISEGYSDVTVSPKTLEGWVGSNGTIFSGSGFTVKRNAVGNYTVSWPAGTLYQCCGPLPTVFVRSTWGSSLGNISYIWHGGDGSGTFTVDFSGVDTNFIFNMTQTY